IVRGLCMASISIFRFQNIMYVVEIFAVISEGGTLRASTRIARIIEQHLKYKSVPPEIWYTVRTLCMALLSIFRFKILCTLWKYSRLYLKATSQYAHTWFNEQHLEYNSVPPEILYTVRRLEWHLSPFSDFKILCTLSKNSRLYLKASSSRLSTRKTWCI